MEKKVRKKVLVDTKDEVGGIAGMTEVHGGTDAKKIGRNMYHEFYIGEDVFHASERMAKVSDGKLYINTEYLKKFGLHV